MLILVLEGYMSVMARFRGIAAKTNFTGNENLGARVTFLERSRCVHNC